MASETDMAKVTVVEKLGRPPAYGDSTTNKRTGGRPTTVWGLMFYAGAVTAALVTVCVFGALYGQGENSFQLSPIDNEPPTELKHYKYGSPDGKRDEIDIDGGREREVFRQGQGHGNDTVVVLDFEKDIGGIYDAEQQQCYLMRDLDGLPHASQLSQLLDETMTAESAETAVGGSADTVHYVVDRPVTNLSVIPPELITPGWGKPVHLLKKKAYPKGVKRLIKRGGSRRTRILWGLIDIKKEWD